MRWIILFQNKNAHAQKLDAGKNIVIVFQKGVYAMVANVKIAKIAFQRRGELPHLELIRKKIWMNPKMKMNIITKMEFRVQKHKERCAIAQKVIAWKNIVNVLNKDLIVIQYVVALGTL